MKVKMNTRQNLEESAKFLAKILENGKIKIKIGFNFQIFNNTGPGSNT
jgi:hypothetical protein